MGELELAPIEFQATCDAAQGGVLLALPALRALRALARVAGTTSLPGAGRVGQTWPLPALILTAGGIEYN